MSFDQRAKEQDPWLTRMYPAHVTLNKNLSPCGLPGCHSIDDLALWPHSGWQMPLYIIKSPSRSGSFQLWLNSIIFCLFLCHHFYICDHQLSVNTHLWCYCTVSSTLIDHSYTLTQNLPLTPHQTWTLNQIFTSNGPLNSVKMFQSPTSKIQTGPHKDIGRHTHILAHTQAHMYAQWILVFMLKYVSAATVWSLVKGDMTNGFGI